MRAPQAAPFSSTDTEHLGRVLREAVEASRALVEGAPAAYIPELAQVDVEQTSAAVTLVDGTLLAAGDALHHRFTLQSSAKLVLLAGLLEEIGEQRVFSLVGAEPSGASFASIARLETDARPANPLVNAGAIALCSLIPGGLVDKLGWLEGWTERLYGERLPVNTRVLASERTTGDRNRAIAWYLKGAGILAGPVDEILEAYFTLCSFEAGVAQVSRLGAVLAGGGAVPGAPGGVPPLLSRRTVGCVISLMATCGMYDESGAHLLATGLPAKSGVSGVIAAVAPGRAGIAVASPRVNAKGGSVRGHHVLGALARDSGWQSWFLGG
ncbi:MAG TPA: glutaminase A [Thermoanaerobaculia bacterium]|nr:glutaminase A [Thermoanaerobaculia bacterium]